MPKTAKQPKKDAPNPVQSVAQYPQTIAASNIGATWSNYVSNTSSPNIMWQGTTSGATYTSASNLTQAMRSPS